MLFQVILALSPLQWEDFSASDLRFPYFEARIIHRFSPATKSARIARARRSRQHTSPANSERRRYATFGRRVGNEREREQHRASELISM